MWEIKLKKYLDREDTTQENENNMYDIVIGQCIPSLHLTIKRDDKYFSKSIFLFNMAAQEIEEDSSRGDTKSKPALTLHEQMRDLFSIIQGKTEAYDD